MKGMAFEENETIVINNALKLIKTKKKEINSTRKGIIKVFYQDLRKTLGEPYEDETTIYWHLISTTLDEVLIYTNKKYKHGTVEWKVKGDIEILEDIFE